jgi:glucose uptake protein GlcU
MTLISIATITGLCIIAICVIFMIFESWKTDNHKKNPKSKTFKTAEIICVILNVVIIGYALLD